MATAPNPAGSGTDLNGDGSLEVVLSDMVWEGGGVGFVYLADTGYQRGLYVACGT